MSGIDDFLASYSDGSGVWIVLLAAVLLGLRHATDPDHLAAVTTLVATGREHAARTAAGLGLAWGAGSKFRHGELDLIFDGKHPIARNLSRVHLHDESYWNLKGNPANITLLASGEEENAMQPLMWCKEQDKGRVFVSIPGHYSWTFDDPLFRIVLLRGVAWSAHEPVDRFNNLVPLGASLNESR